MHICQNIFRLGHECRPPARDRFWAGQLAVSSSESLWLCQQHALRSNRLKSFCKTPHTRTDHNSQNGQFDLICDRRPPPVAADPSLKSFRIARPSAEAKDVPESPRRIVPLMRDAAIDGVVFTETVLFPVCSSFPSSVETPPVDTQYLVEDASWGTSGSGTPPRRTTASIFALGGKRAPSENISTSTGGQMPKSTEAPT